MPIFEICNEEREVVNTDLFFTLWQFTIDGRGKKYLVWNYEVAIVTGFIRSKYPSISYDFGICKRIYY